MVKSRYDAELEREIHLAARQRFQCDRTSIQRHKERDDVDGPVLWYGLFLGLGAELELLGRRRTIGELLAMVRQTQCIDHLAAAMRKGTTNANHR